MKYLKPWCKNQLCGLFTQVMNHIGGAMVYVLASITGRSRNI